MAPKKKVVVTAAKKSVSKSVKHLSTKPLSATKPKAAAKLVVKEPLTKVQIIAHLAEATGVKRKDVINVFDHLTQMMGSHLNKKGPGEFNFFGLMKFRVIQKPATKVRHGINPFNGEPMVFAAKPARNSVKIRPLKKLKTLIS